MPSHILAFAATDGGFNGSNAIQQTGDFFIDIGKDNSFATLVIQDTSGGLALLNYGTVLGIEVLITDARSEDDPESSVDVSLFHYSDNAYTTAIEVAPGMSSVDELIVGGTSNTWGKDWSADDINNIKIKIDNPQEFAGGIAFKGNYVTMRVTYQLSAEVNIPMILSQGKIQISEGKIFI